MDSIASHSDDEGGFDSNQNNDERRSAASVAPIDVPHVEEIEEEGSKAKKQKGKQAAAPTRKRASATASVAVNVKAANKARRSWVWDHFEKYPEPLFAIVDGVKKEVGHTPRAKCKHCSNTFASDSVNGTSTLRKHIEQHCKKYVGSSEFQEDNQSVFSTDGELRKEWSQQSCIDAVTVMIVVDELPFSFIERPGFNHFLSYAVPRFEVPCRKIICKNFLRMYHEKKEKMKIDLKKYSICLTTDTWTSCQNINYMVITAHFIDDAWTMHKKILNFCLIPDHQGTTIGRILEQCLVDWGIEKVLTVSVDNASTNEKAIQYLRKKMSRWDNPPLYGGQYMHVRCLAHIINLIVRSGLSLMDKAVDSIRNVVRYVRSSSARLDAFKLCVEKDKVECKKICILDVPTRWNSTYLMLSTALELKKAFDRLAEEEEGKYRSYFNEDEDDGEEDEVTNNTKKGRKRVGPPTEEDWEQAMTFVKFLSIFYEVTLRMSAQLKPTSPTAFHSIVSIKAELDDLFTKPITASSSPTEKILHDMTVKMKLKYEKYFNSVDEVNQLYLVALLLDPRYKLKNFEMTCEIMLGMDPSEVKQKSAEVKNLLQCLCDLYGASHFGSTSSRRPTASGESSRSTTSTPLNQRGSKLGGFMLSGKMAAMLQKWGKDLEEGEGVVVSHEVDRYLWDPMERQVADEKFNILDWWKLNGEKYPSLQLVAKDVMAIQVSTVASESSFSTGKRVIDPYRSSLTPKSVEALICLQNWICSTAIIGLHYVPELKEMEMMESLEKEIEREQREIVDEAPNPPIPRVEPKPKHSKRKNPRTAIVLNP